MALSKKEDRIFSLLTKKQGSGISLSNKELRMLELISKKAGKPASTEAPQERSFGQKALEVAGGVAAGITNFTGGSKQVGQAITDMSALTAVPVTGKEDFKDTPLLETAGGMAGGAAGLVVGGPVGAVVGGGIGSGLGRAGDEGIRKAIGVSDVKGTGDLAKKVGFSTGVGAFGEGIAGFGIKGASKLLAPFKKKVLPDAERAIQFFKDKTDHLFLPAEATDSGVLDLIENISEASIFGRGSIKRFKANREAFLNDFLDDFVNKFNGESSPADLGNLVVSIINDRISVFDDLAKPFYNTAEELTKDLFETIPATTVIKGISKQGRGKALDIDARTLSIKTGKPTTVDPKTGRVIESEVFESTVPDTSITPSGSQQRIDLRTLNQARDKVGIINMKDVKNALVGSKEIAEELNNIGSEVTGSGLSNKILGLDDNISFAAAKDLRSTLIKLADQFKLERKNAPAVAAMNRIAGHIDEAVTKSLRKHSPEALAAWREGNRIIKQKSKELQNKFLRKLVKMADPGFGNNPEGLVNAVFKKGSISNVNNLKKAVNEQTWTKIKGWLTRDLIAKATDRDGTLIGRNLKEAMFGRSGLGKEVMELTYTKDQINTLENVINTIVISQEKQGENTGKMLIQLSQGGGLALLAAGKVTAAAPILVGPVVAGKMLTNKVIGRLLTKGYKLPVGSKELARTWLKLTAAVANLEREENRKINASRKKQVRVNNANNRRQFIGRNAQ